MREFEPKNLFACESSAMREMVVLLQPDAVGPCVLAVAWGVGGRGQASLGGWSEQGGTDENRREE